jgi:hypothetical protein
VTGAKRLDGSAKVQEIVSGDKDEENTPEIAGQS